MNHHAITEAVMKEAYSEVKNQYTTSRKIKGFFYNKLAGGVRSAFGAATSKTDAAKQIGRHAAGAVPKVLAFGAKQIPVVGSLASALVSKGAPIGVNKVMDKLGAGEKARAAELKTRASAGSLTVREMTELLLKEDASVTSGETMTKLHDSIRKLDEAYAAARTAIQAASDCDSMYKAAKAFSYLKHRVARTMMYQVQLQAHLDKVREATERYEAVVIGYELDLTEGMDEFFNGPAGKGEYHQAHCKNKDTCYFQA